MTPPGSVALPGTLAVTVWQPRPRHCRPGALLTRVGAEASEAGPPQLPVQFGPGSDSLVSPGSRRLTCHRRPR